MCDVRGIILSTCQEISMGEFRVKMCQFSTNFPSPLKMYHKFFVGAKIFWVTK